MRKSEQELRRSLSLQKNRTLRQGEKQRMIVDFLQYIDALIQVYRLSQKLDSAGDTLHRIFEGSSGSSRLRAKAAENFRNWLINFDIWGSYMPLSAQSWDIQLARAAAYEKLSIFRASIREILKQNKLARESKAASKSGLEENAALANLMTQLSLVEFYLAKIESYLRRKHESILKEHDVDDSASSVNYDTTSEKSEGHANPRSTQADEVVSETENDADLEFYDKIQKIKARQKKAGTFGRKQREALHVEFGDFLEPHLIKTGHLIPLSCGHNSPFSKVELSIYEIHLTNAGFIVQPEVMDTEDGQATDDDEHNKSGDAIFEQQFQQMDVQPFEGEDLEHNEPGEDLENNQVGVPQETFNEDEEIGIG